jgi:hypothetical protein
MRQVETWREKLTAFTTAQQFNEAIPQMTAIQTPMVKHQVIKASIDIATAKGIPFDKGTKLFVQPQAQPAGTAA